MRRLLLLVISFAILAGQLSGPALAAGRPDHAEGAGNAPDSRGKAEASDTRGRRPSDAELDELARKAREQGFVDVIVGLGAEIVPEGHLDDAAVVEQRGRFARLQDEALQGLAGSGHRVHSRFESVPALVLSLPERAVEALRRNPHVASVSEHVPVQAGLFESAGIVGAPAVWQGNVTGTNQIVAVLDTGVEASHPFVAGRIVDEACFSSQALCNGQTTRYGAGAGAPCSGSGCDHGTHVAGIAAGSGSNYSGVAPGAGIMAIRTLHPRSGAGDLHRSLEHVLARVRAGWRVAAVNMSIWSEGYATAGTCDTMDPTFKQIVDNLRSYQVPTVVITGNGGRERYGISYPGCISSVVSVGATTKQDAIAAFSSTSTHTSLLAPGQQIASAVLGGQYDYKNGTSMAAPHVAGAWALIKQRYPTATIAQVLAALVQTGRSVTDSRYTQTITKPRIRVDAAIAALAPASNTNAGNGTFATAAGVTQLPFQHEVDTTSAPFEQGEPVSGLGDCSGIGRTVWYRLVPSASLTIDVSTAGSNFDTVLAVWRGTSMQALQPVACNDDVDRANQNLLSRVQVQLQAGQTYYIQAGGYWSQNTGARTGNLRLTVTSPDTNTNADTNTNTNTNTNAQAQAQAYAGGRIDASEPTTVAVRISQTRFGDGQANYVVVSRNDLFADSLAGAPLTKDGPLLFTASAQLTAQTAAEIQRVLAPGGVVYLLGGRAAITQDVEDDLTGRGYQPARLGGATRIETAIRIATEVRSRNPEGTTVAIARAGAPADNPTAGWADSVTGGAWAAGTGTPILLNPSDVLNPAVDEALRRFNPQVTVLFGGTAALSRTVEESVRNPFRFAGAERAGTAADIAHRLWREPGGFVVINGYREDGWAFGLAAAGLAVHTRSPLILVTGDRIPDPTMAVVRARACAGTPVMSFIGSREVIGAAPEVDLQTAAQGRLGC